MEGPTALLKIMEYNQHYFFQNPESPVQPETQEQSTYQPALESNNKRRIPKNVKLMLAVFFIIVAGFSAYHFLGAHSSKFYSSSAPASNLPPGPSPVVNKHYVVVTAIDTQYNYTTSSSNYLSISPAISAFNVTPGSKENISFSIYLPPSTGTSYNLTGNVVQIKSIYSGTKGFSVTYINPLPPINISQSTEKTVELSIQTPDTNYTGSIAIVFSVS